LIITIQASIFQVLETYAQCLQITGLHTTKGAIQSILLQVTPMYNANNPSIATNKGIVKAYLAILSFPTSPLPEALFHCCDKYLGT